MGSEEPIRVLVAGTGGASLGTEIVKSLGLAGGYEVFGCDISRHAYGHYQEGLAETFVADRRTYVASIIDICARTGARWVIPGGEQPLALLNTARGRLTEAGVGLAANSPEVIEIASDKARTFETLGKLGFRIPLTRVIEDSGALDGIQYPCVVKPATDSGGSANVFLTTTRADAAMYVDHLRTNGYVALIQEYLPLNAENGGEFTIGVLSLPTGEVVCSVALERLFHTKLSVRFSSSAGLISSGYSQGRIDDFGALRMTAERIATAIGSTGPINVQGRVSDGEFVPFEINPRFSASTHLRSLAGANEIDIYMRYLARGEVRTPEPLRPGYYLRSLDELHVRIDEVKQ